MVSGMEQNSGGWKHWTRGATCYSSFVRIGSVSCGAPCHLCRHTPHSLSNYAKRSSGMGICLSSPVYLGASSKKLWITNLISSLTFSGPGTSVPAQAPLPPDRWHQLEWFSPAPCHIFAIFIRTAPNSTGCQTVFLPAGFPVWITPSPVTFLNMDSHYCPIAVNASFCWFSSRRDILD